MELFKLKDCTALYILDAFNYFRPLDFFCRKLQSSEVFFWKKYNKINDLTSFESS